MRRASDDVLKQRIILKASKPSPQRGMPLATEDVLSQRKIVKVKRPIFGSSLGSKPSDDVPIPSATAPAPERRRGDGGAASEEGEVAAASIAMRAKLFSKDGAAGWARVGAGTLRCCRAAGRRRLRLRSGDGAVLFEQEAGALRGLTTVTKRSSKGSASYVKFSAVVDAAKGEESFLIQTKPELVNDLYAFCSFSDEAPCC